MSDETIPQDNGAAGAVSTIAATDDPEGDVYYAQRSDPDRTRTAILSFPGVAERYNSGSCFGSGVSFPELWAVVKDYILTGDEYYQSGGLSALTATIWQMPLDAAADVIEQYFRQHHYAVLVGGRPSPSLAAVQAAYAVGTTVGWDGEDKMAERRERMARVLEFYKFRLRQMGYTATANNGYASDDEMVQEAIDAIRNNTRDFDAQLSFRSMLSASHNANTGSLNAVLEGTTLVATGSLQVNGSATPTVIPANVTRDEVVSIAMKIVEQHTQQGVLTLTQSDAMAVKHGHDMLGQRMQFLEMFSTQRMDTVQAEISGRLDRLAAKIETQDKAIDRYIGNQQVSWTKWGALIAVVAIVVAVVTWAVATFMS